MKETVRKPILSEARVTRYFVQGYSRFICNRLPALCIKHYKLCIMNYALCIKHYELCIMNYYLTPLSSKALLYLAALARCSLYDLAKLCVPEKASLAHI